MNLKKGLIRTIAIGIVLVGTITLSSNVKAATGSKKLKLDNPTMRSGYIYRAGWEYSGGTQSRIFYVENI